MPFNPSFAPRVLVVEDEFSVALLIEDMLEDIGCVVVASVARLDQAIEAAEAHALDAAILDVNLGGRTSYEVADALIRRGVPFVFSTGYGASGVKAEYRAVPVVQKPFRAEDLEAALRRALTPAVS